MRDLLSDVFQMDFDSYGDPPESPDHTMVTGRGAADSGRPRQPPAAATFLRVRNPTHDGHRVALVTPDRAVS